MLKTLVYMELFCTFCKKASLLNIFDVYFEKEALHLVLADGREVSAPMEWFPRLKKATPKQLSNWSLIGDGLVIHWPDVDEDIEKSVL